MTICVLCLVITMKISLYYYDFDEHLCNSKTPEKLRNSYLHYFFTNCTMTQCTVSKVYMYGGIISLYSRCL